MQTIWIHLVAFFQVVVINCIQPVNWKYCYRVDQWLIPDVIEAIKIKTIPGYFKPYKSEQEYLKELKL